MKKITALTIAGVFTASLAATAFAEMADIKVGGEIRVRGESVNTDEQATYRRTLQRTRVNVDAKLNETTKAYLSIQDSRIWGEEGSTANTADETENTDVSQAWFQLDKLAGAPLSLKVGRQALAYGEHRLVGSFEWSNNARRFDALKLMLNTDAVGVDLWTAKLVEDSDTSNADSNFNGLYVTVKSIPNNALDIYLLQDMCGDNSATCPERDVKTYGLRVKGDVVGLDYAAEVAKQTGDYNATRDQDALAYAVKVGYTIPAAAGLRIGAEYDYASGNEATMAAGDDNEAFQNLYPTNHYLYGFTDDIGWSNIKAWSLNASVKPVADLSVGVEYWNYTLAEDNAAGDDDAGSEINILAKYKLNPNVAIEAAWARRTAGDTGATAYDVGQGGGNRVIADDDNSDFAYLMANVTF